MTENIYAKAVVIGASAGALDALMKIFPALPADFPLPIVTVVHIPPDRKSILPQLFKERSALTFCEAEDKEPLEPAHVYFAAPDYHLLTEASGELSLSGDEPVLFSRPSIDVLFESAADAFGEGVIGIILTGANEDGARGLRRIIDAGGKGLVQHPSQAHAPAMPEAAIKMCPEASVLSIEEITACLRNIATAR